MQVPHRKPGQYSQQKLDPLITQEKFHALEKDLARLKQIRPKAAADVAQQAESITTMASHALFKPDLDPSVSPGDDFYQYAVGGWLKRNELPPEYSRWGSFEIVSENTLDQLRRILEHPELFAGADKNSVDEQHLARLLAGFYRLGMDESKIEQLGLSPLAAGLESVDRLGNVDELAGWLGVAHLKIGNPLFSFSATPDAKNSKMMLAAVGQGGLGLPDRDYYLKTDPQSEQIQRRYREYITKLLALGGLKNADKTAEGADAAKEASAVAARDIFALETELARVSMSREDLRDPLKTYHKMTLAQAAELMPSFRWPSFLDAINLSDPGPLDIGQPDFFVGLDKLLNTVPLSTWKNYLRYHLISGAASFLSAAFVNEQFAFYNQFLSGQKVIKPRWKRVARTIGQILPMPLGRLYVKEYFPASAKERAEKLVGRLISTMRQRLAKLDWMGDGTKQEAYRKLDRVRIKIGYPDRWDDYGALRLDESSYVAAAQSARRFETEKDLKKIGRPVDPTEWLMAPHEVNAYYEPLKNEIVFPAGILQSPFFYAEGDEAVNYGGIGGVIGHEITHGFDDQGRKYDADGNLRDWWTAEDARRFEERAAALAAQYDSYRPFPDAGVNGRFTLGENIADLGGATLAYEAWAALGKEVKIALEDIPAEQRFFLAWAQVWKLLIAESHARLLLTIDPHAPGKYRVIGPLTNHLRFAAAFNLKESQPMHKKDADRVSIW